MSGEPGATRGEHAPGRAVDRSGNAPEVGIVVGHPAPTAIHLLSRHGTRLAEVANHREEGFLRLGKVADKGRPVVHLDVDVDGVLRVPGGVHLVVPHALQVSGLTTGLARRDKQVAAVLHHKTYHVEVGGIFLKSGHTLVGLQTRVRRLRQT